MLSVMGVRSPVPANAPPSPNSFFLLHESPVAVVLIDSFVFIHNEHSTASRNNTAPPPNSHPATISDHEIRQTKSSFSLLSLFYFLSSNQIR